MRTPVGSGRNCLNPLFDAEVLVWGPPRRELLKVGSYTCAKAVWCILLFAAMGVLAGGCREHEETPVGVARGFVVAVVHDNREALRETLTKDSQDMLEHSQPGTGIRTFSYLLGRGIVEEGSQYELVLVHTGRHRAQVNLKAGKQPTQGFSDASLPASFRRTGVPIIVRKDDGKWRVDLLATMELLVEHAPEDTEITPKWWPGLPGVPNAPTPTRPNPEHQAD